MDELSLKIDHVFKEYRLGAIGAGTLKGELQSKFAKLRHKEDPNLKIGQKAHEKNERFLALNDVSLEVKKGERIGIIGHNGAGKSTLLKLICRVTAPTKGTIYLNGRITSMLEVGTGFHGELTGRENLYLNGAILGMTKEEINAKFDEIVEFSEIEQFIDTPVKRYSSGMNVKLGFSVASHLNSEIVIMDEVLAVGDVNFQNKCIAQMRKLAEEEGRTIIYVSHNMATVKNLCDRCIVLSHGEKIFDGGVEEAISVYVANDKLDNTTFFDTSEFQRNPRFNKRHMLQSLELVGAQVPRFAYGEKFRFRIRWKSENNDEGLRFKLIIHNIESVPVGVAFGGELKHQKGDNSADFIFDTSFLIPAAYTVYMIMYDEDEFGNVMYYDSVNALRFEVLSSSESIGLKNWFKNWGNTVLPCVEKAE